MQLNLNIAIFNLNKLYIYVNIILFHTWNKRKRARMVQTVHEKKINLNSEEMFKINDTVIEKVEYIIFLGFVIDRKLNFNEQIDYLCTRVGKKISI